jgi:K+-sensing histidine kinase KdpD
MPTEGLDSVSVSDWVALAAVFVGIFALLFALLQFRTLGAQRASETDEIREATNAILESQHHQRTADLSAPIQYEVIGRVVSEFSNTAEKMDLNLYELRAILEELQAETRMVSIRQSSSDGGSSRVEISSTRPHVDSAQVIRELAHSLGTPLAQIKAEALRLGALSGGKEKGFDRIVASVDLCNSFIASFREIARISSHGSILSLASLGTALRTATDVYTSRNGKSVGLDVAVPDQISGYSNTYLLSILAPLVENAIEASPDGDIVSIHSMQDETSLAFFVENKYQGEPPSGKSFMPGISNKKGHEGMGLATVKRLVEAQRDGSVDYSVNENSVKFSIHLPGGSND